MKPKRSILLAVVIGLFAVVIWFAATSPRRPALSSYSVKMTNDAKGGRQMVFSITNRQSRAVRYWANETIQVKVGGTWKRTPSSPFYTGDLPGRSSQDFRRPIPRDVDAAGFGLNFAKAPNVFDRQLEKLCRLLSIRNPWPHPIESIWVETGP